MNQLPPLGKSKDKFTPELRILVASLLSMAVILLWAKYFGPKPPVNPPQENKPAQVSPATPGNPAPTTTPSPATVPSVKISAATTPAVSPAADSQERTIVVENALYRVEFSNRGAVVKSWQLKNYTDDSKPQKTLDLVHPQAATETGGWPFALVFDDPQLGTLANSGLYKISSDANSLKAPADLTFTWSDGHLQVTKKFHFDHSYTVNVETTVTNNGNHVMAGLAWLGGFGDLTVTNPIPVETVFVFYSEGGKLESIAHKKLEGPEKPKFYHCRTTAVGAPKDRVLGQSSAQKNFDTGYPRAKKGSSQPVPTSIRSRTILAGSVCFFVSRHTTFCGRSPSAVASLILRTLRLLLLVLILHNTILAVPEVHVLLVEIFYHRLNPGAKLRVIH